MAGTTDCMQRWVGHVALVTGASTGIGQGIARSLVKHGMKVIGCARVFYASIRKMVGRRL